MKVKWKLPNPSEDLLGPPLDISKCHQCNKPITLEEAFKRGTQILCKECLHNGK